MAKKKSFLVMGRNTDIASKGLMTGKGHLKFKAGKNSMHIGDEALAQEVDAIHGKKGTGDVWVHEDPQSEPFLRDDGAIGRGVHKYFWGSTSRFSKAWEAFEARRKDKVKK